MKEPQKIKGMFTKDLIALIVFAAAAVIFGIFVLSQMIPLSTGGGKIALIILPCTSIVVFIWAMTTTAAHLRKNKKSIYEEDLHYQKLLHGEEDKQ